jgi:HK97 family phage major capsid protein
MPTLLEERDAALRSAKAIFDGAKAATRDVTEDENVLVKSYLDNADELTARIKRANESEQLVKRLGGLAPQQETPQISSEEPEPKSLGEFFVKRAGGEQAFRAFKSGAVRSLIADGYGVKANTDPNTVGTSLSAVLTDVDRTIVRGFRRPVVSDVLGTGAISGTGVTYYVEGGVEGSFATVAEAAQKPQAHFINPTPVTDRLTKIAAWWDTSDEMVEDLPYLVSEVNNRGLYLLSLAEESQLLYGDGTGTNLTGLTNRSGIQTEAQGASNDNAQDTIFRAMTKVSTATGLTADAIIINPADYQTLRLAKDANNQYYGGGYFYQPYGEDNQAVGAGTPALWGLRTIITPAVAAKTVLVGAFQASATVYRKGGVRVESTNSDLGKFTKNIITTRIEERLALAVRIPLATVKVTLV